MSREKKSYTGLRAGQVVEPGVGQDLTELQHDMTRAEQVKQPVSFKDIGLRQIMRDISSKGTVEERPEYKEVVIDDTPHVKVNPYHRQSVHKAEQRARQSVDEAMRQQDAADTQKGMREASDKIRARSFKDGVPSSQSQMSVSEMMERDEKTSHQPSRQRDRSGKKRARNKTERSKNQELSDRVAQGKNLEVKAASDKANVVLKKSTGATKSFEDWTKENSKAMFSEPVKRKDGAKVVTRVEHHDMSRSDRLAAAQASLGGIVARVTKKQEEELTKE